MPSMTFVLPFVVAMALVTPVLAQGTAPALPVTEDAGRLVLEAQRHRLTLPKPDWISDSAEGWAELVSPRFADIDNQAHLEIYPRGEGEAFWNTIYGARITSLARPVVTDFRALVVDVYARTCRPEATAFFQLEPDDGENIPPLGFVCGAYRDSRDADKGEVTVIAFYKSETGIAMLYQGWRGDAFDIGDTATWPVTPGVVEEHVSRFSADVSLSQAD